jgi:uncharacterized protein YecE (DUF72 family)
MSTTRDLRSSRVLPIPDRTSIFASLCADVPDGFRFAFKVTDDITIKKFPSHARFGTKAGTFNPNFLNPALFRERFLGPCGFGVWRNP